MGRAAWGVAMVLLALACASPVRMGPPVAQIALRCPTAASNSDRAELGARLGSSGLDADVIITGPDTVRIDLFRAADLSRVTALLAPGTLELFEVVDSGAAAGPVVTLLQRDGTAVTVTGAALLGNADVARAEATVGAGGEPTVSVELTPEGGRRFAEVTTRLKGRRLAVVVDGTVWMAPTVSGPITGGSVAITLGSGAGPADAEAMAATLGNGRLTCAWTLDSASMPAAPGG